MMKGIHVFIVRYFLQFLFLSRRTGYNMGISQKPMTWVESFNYCKLSTEKDVKLFNARYTAWGSGVYLNTRWMIHKGCYKSSDTVDSKNVQAIANNSPSLCSDQCEMSLHFALKFNWCLCLNSIHNMAKVTSDKCKYTCVGSKDDSCGDRIHYSVYSHVTGKKKPLQDSDSKHTCSVVIRKKTRFILKAVDCFRLYWTACEMQSGAITIMGHGLSYRSAINRCSLHGNSLPTINEHGVNNLEEGKMYWTNIHRRTFLKWIKDEPVNQICDKVQASLGCLLVLRETNGNVQYIQESCQSKFPAICDQVGVKGRADTMYCKTKNLNFLSTLSKSVLTSTSRTTKTTQVSKKSSKLQPENPPVSNVQSTIVYRSKTSSVTTKAHTTLPTTTRTELLPTTTFIHTSTILSGASTTSKNVSQQPLSVEPCSGVNSTTKTSKQYNDIIRTEDFFVIFYIQIGIVALVTFVAFVLVCLLTYIITLLRKGRETKQSSQYELSARTTPEPRMYSQLLMPSQRIYSSTRSNSVDNPLF